MNLQRKKEPLTEPLGSYYTHGSFTPDDALTLVQYRASWTRTTPSRARLAQLPLTAAELNLPLHPFEPERNSHTAMGWVRDKAHARLAAMEAATHSAAFRDARLALRRAYAAHKLTASRAAPFSHVTSAASRRHRARAAWLQAAGLSAFSMLLACALTLQFIPQRENTPQRSAPTGCVSSASAKPDSVSTEEAGSQPVQTVYRARDVAHRVRRGTDPE